MKTIILATLMFFTSLSLSADDFKKETTFLNLTSIEIFQNEIVPSFELELSPKVLNKFDFMIAYASNLFAGKKSQVLKNRKNPKMQNIYLTLNYRF